MDVSVLRATNPREFVERFLANGARPDGRNFQDIRPFDLKTKVIRSSVGSAVARVGNSSVVAGITASTTTPKVGDKSRGFLTVSVQNPEMSKRESAAFADSIQTVLQSATDFESLCLQVGKSVWNLEIGITVLENDGSLFDACLIATTGAQISCTLPALTEDLKISSDLQGTHYEGRRIKMSGIPVSITYRKFAGNLWLPDCSGIEEKASNDFIIVGGNYQDQDHHAVGIIDMQGDCDSLTLASVLQSAQAELIHRANHILAHISL